jgi:toxin ParE1/3/4
MKSYRLSRRARADIHEIWDYLAVERESPDAAHNQIESLYAKFSLLATSPLLGEARDDLKQGLRAFSADRYVVFYYALDRGIEIVAVVHGARDLEGLFRRGDL